MKTVEDLARLAGDDWDSTQQRDKDFLTRFHTLAIEQEHKRLLEESGELPEPDIYEPIYGYVGYRTSAVESIVEAVVLRERERCLDCYSPDDTVTDYQDKIRNPK